MYSSSRKRCPKTKWALKILTAAFLAASPAAKSAVNNAYDALMNPLMILVKIIRGFISTRLEIAGGI